MSWTEIIDGCGCCNCCGTARVFLTYSFDDEVEDEWAIIAMAIYWLNSDGTAAGQTYLTASQVAGAFSGLGNIISPPSVGDTMTGTVSSALSKAIDCGTVSLAVGESFTLECYEKTMAMARFVSGYIIVCE